MNLITLYSNEAFFIDNLETLIDHQDEFELSLTTRSGQVLTEDHIDHESWAFLRRYDATVEIGGGGTWTSAADLHKVSAVKVERSGLLSARFWIKTWDKDDRTCRNQWKEVGTLVAEEFEIEGDIIKITNLRTVMGNTIPHTTFTSRGGYELSILVRHEWDVTAKSYVGTWARNLVAADAEFSVLL
jgi:hypothetical protein